jgi:hypothetical protein
MIWEKIILGVLEWIMALMLIMIVLYMVSWYLAGSPTQSNSDGNTSTRAETQNCFKGQFYLIKEIE